MLFHLLVGRRLVEAEGVRDDVGHAELKRPPGGEGGVNWPAKHDRRVDGQPVDLSELFLEQVGAEQRPVRRLDVGATERQIWSSWLLRRADFSSTNTATGSHHD